MLTLSLKAGRLEEYVRDGHCRAPLGCGDLPSAEGGPGTLFVNAAMEDLEGRLSQLHWLVEPELPVASSEEE